MSQQVTDQGQEQNQASQANNPTRVVQKKSSKYKAKQKTIQAKQRPIQAKQKPVEAKQKPVQAKQQPVVRSNAGGTQGLPEPMKNNMEAMGGVDLSDVKVHHNSSQPEQVGALAYAQGNDIHLGPGQEKHLGHEAWHTVQQKQGRVKPTRMYKRSTPVNDEAHLEREADTMANQAMQCKCANCACGKKQMVRQNQTLGASQVVQRVAAGPATIEFGDDVLDFYGDTYEMRDNTIDWIWDNTSGRVIEEIKDTEVYKNAADKVEQISEEASIYLLDKVLPVGQGYQYDLAVGVTWGAPIYTGGGGIVYVKRKDEKTVHLLVQKYKAAGVDAGIGGSLAAGGKKKSKDKNSAVVEATAGANVQTGLQMTSVEEYEIPVGKLIPFLGEALQDQLDDVGGMVFRDPLNSLLSKNDSPYLVSESTDMTLYAQADTEVGLGAKRASDEYQGKDMPGGHKGGASTWGPDGERDFQGSLPKLLAGDPLALANSLSKLLNSQLRGQVNVGKKVQKQGKKTITTVSLDGEVTAMLGLPIPVINTFLAMLPNGVGVGLELIFTEQPGKETTITLQIYQKTGEDKVYEGSYNKQAFVFDITSLISYENFIQAFEGNTVPFVADDIYNVFEGVNFENRILLSGPAFGRLGSFLRKQQGTRSLLKDKTKKLTDNAGFNLDVYLDFNSHLGEVDFKVIVEEAAKVFQGAKSATKKSDGFIETLKALEGYLFDNSNPELDKLMDEILARVVVDKALVRIQLTAGAGFSAKAAAVAKARADFSVQAGMFCELDAMQHLGQSGELNLKGFIDGFPELMNHPKKFFSDCPIIDFIMSLSNKSRSGGGKGGGSGKSKGKGGGHSKTKKTKKAGKESKSDDSRLRSLNVDNKAKKYTNALNFEYRILRAKKNENGTYEMNLVIQNLEGVEIGLPRLKFSLVEDNTNELILKLLTPWTISHETLGSGNPEDYLSSEKGEIYIFDKI